MRKSEQKESSFGFWLSMVSYGRVVIVWNKSMPQISFKPGLARSCVEVRRRSVIQDKVVAERLIELEKEDGSRA